MLANVDTIKLLQSFGRFGGPIQKQVPAEG